MSCFHSAATRPPLPISHAAFQQVYKAAPSARTATRHCWRRPRHLPRAAAGSRQADWQAEGPLRSLAELFGDTGDDPGHWNFSPEWWGNQDGGWGRDAGVTVFAADSGCGNGRVEVTAHPASPLKKRSSSSSSGTAGGSGSSFAPPPGSWEEWRVLRFNGVTRQTVMRVHVAPGGDGSNGRQQLVLTQPDCLAQEYLKTTAAVAAALLALQHLLPRSSSGSSSNGSGGAGAGAVGGRRPRTLCIGVGGGSLPLFLAHHFPCMDVEGVELDPAVVAAATAAMGLPPPHRQPNLRLHTADAALFMRGLRRDAGDGGGSGGSGGDGSGGSNEGATGCYDLIIMDTFDGEDNVPPTLCTPEYAALVGAALHPRHGCFLLNLHSLEGSNASVAATFKAALLHAAGSGDGGDGGDSGSCLAVTVQRQRNVCVAVARGLAAPSGGVLRVAAADAAGEAGYRFAAGSRACHELRLL